MSENYRKPIVKTLMLKGKDGQSIKEIKKTSTSGLIDTYEISLTDGTKKSFTVSNGKGIKSIAKTSTSGLVDTYTIAYNDDTTSTFKVNNGKGANEWVELENLTISEAQKFKKKYDSFYSDYMCEIRIPKANGNILMNDTHIFGNYGLYYKNINSSDAYSCVAILIAEKIVGKTYLMSCAYGIDSSISDFKNRTIKIVDNPINLSQIYIEANLPIGTTIKVWGR